MSNYDATIPISNLREIDILNMDDFFVIDRNSGIASGRDTYKIKAKVFYNYIKDFANTRLSEVSNMTEDCIRRVNGVIDTLSTQEEAREIKFDKWEEQHANMVSEEQIRFNNEKDRIRVWAEWTEFYNDTVDRENSRIQNENTRVTNENNRISDENQRVQNESARILAEDDRIDSEDIRKTNETTRIENETKRIADHKTQSEFYNDCVEQESIRQANEQIRITNEDQRDSAETLREIRETQRYRSEEQRVAAETLRETNETDREAEEEKRQTAESTRASNESQRIQDENVRKSNETTRINNEASRATEFNGWKTFLEGIGYWPVGSIYKTVLDQNPATILGGGTWQLCFGGGVTETYSDGTTTYSETIYTWKRTK